MKFRHVWVSIAVAGAFALSTVGCGPTPVEGGEDENANNTNQYGNGGKGDVTVDPIASLSCSAQESFVEVGGFVEVDVDARDDDGRVSRNYTVQVVPNSSARVVQRNKVIFDEAGSYDIRCLSNDSSHTDRTSVMVGYREPALTVNARSFVDRDRVRITGRAVAAENTPLFVELDGYITELSEDGSFDATMPAEVGRLNRFHVQATDAYGRTSDRNVYAVVGKFGDLQEPTENAVRVGMGPDVYPQLAQLVERVISGLPAGQTERSDDDNLAFEDLLSMAEGENLGIDWQFDPETVGSSPPNVTLTPARNGILVDVVFDTAYIDAIVRTGEPGDWRERDMRGNVENLVVSGVLRVNGPDDLGVQDVTTEWESLDVDVSDFPNWIVDIFVWFLEDKFKNMMRDGIERAGNDALVGALEGFGVEKQFDLPDPLETTMTTSSALSTLRADTNGLDIGLSFGIDGETDPLRADVPGPLRFGENATQFQSHEGYQAAIALEPINDLFFAAWQTGSLDLTFDFEEGIETAPDVPQIESVTAFADPQLPPVLSPTDTPGVFRLDIGEVRIDAVFGTSLGFTNVAGVIGLSATVEIAGEGDGFAVQVTVDESHVDVLVAPFSLEREAVEELMEDLVLPALAGDVAQIAANFPIPEADLTGLEIGLSRLAVENVRVTRSAPEAAISVRTDVVVE